ncbi:MAG: tail fiber domain-containing protein, partial [Planctomycetota bacterium]|nr:tail fiber domain-containing protein [Planctomycetota bacterium]
QGAADTAQATADNAATAAGTAQTTADNAATAAGNAQSTADSAATAAGTAQSAADTAQATADNAATAAGTAQTTADNAATAAGNAQSTADNAATAAGNAQSTADSAVTAAGNAQATADFSENLLQNSSGSNTAVGIDALLSNDNGNKNTALGVEALVSNSSGSRNTAVGHKAQQDNVDGRRNTAVGVEALEKNIDGEYNIALGFRAGRDVEGDENIMIGHRGDPDDHHTIRLGGDDDADHERAFIAGIRGVTTGYDDAVSVVIDSEGQLGTISSSRRYKEQIEQMSIHSAPLLQLRPVIFRYRDAYRDGTKPMQYGLIAEEVAQVFPELVVFNDDGKAETVKYQLLSSLLLNEFLKLSDRHQSEASQQQRQIDALQQRVLTLEGLASRLTKLESQISSPASPGEGN